MPETDKLAVSNWMMMVVMMLMMMVVIMLMMLLMMMMMLMLMAAINHRLAEGSKNDITRTDQWMPKNHINMGLSQNQKLSPRRLQILFICIVVICSDNLVLRVPKFDHTHNMTKAFM